MQFTTLSYFIVEPRVVFSKEFPTQTFFLVQKITKSFLNNFYSFLFGKIKLKKFREFNSFVFI